MDEEKEKREARVKNSKRKVEDGLTQFKIKK
jgi:hypothetical protein